MSQTVRPMTDVIRHRGPDDEGFFVADGVGLGMRRLSIIDVEGGHQPIFNEDESVVVVFNGEIYNYRELRHDLQQRGHRFATASDTEVLVHLYEEYGDDCVHHLRGMYAFAIWDIENRRLFVARDRLGIKPLYYRLQGDSLVFASEIKSLLEHADVSASIDLDGLSNYLTLKYVPAPGTMFDGIKALPPGYSMSWEDGRTSMQRYWDLSFAGGEGDRRSESEYTEELESILQESVRLRLRSDVPFGAFLSGGVDSSLIVALMSEILDEPVKTFSVGFAQEGSVEDERMYARMVAEQFGTDHREVMVRSEDFLDLMDDVVWHLDQPIADQATVATLMLSRLASQHVKMVLTGEGGDELFAGYARYSGERLSSVSRFVPGGLTARVASATGRVPSLHRATIALKALAHHDETARFTQWNSLFPLDEKRKLFTSDVAAQLRDVSSDYVFSEYLAAVDAKKPLNRMLYVDTKVWLPDYLLLRGDKLAMAASLEARVPLLDHVLVDFAANLPVDLKLKGMTRKYLLKKVARSRLPDEVIDRKKQGFPIPLMAWLRDGARPLLEENLSPEAVRSRGLFDPRYVSALMEEFDAGNVRAGYHAFSLASVEMWCRAFLD